MTIHKAKGLEFDVVIVPGLGKRGAADPPKLLVWLEQPSDRAEHELLIGPIAETGLANDKVYDYLRSAEKQKVALENGRLLYVAATRARQSLHLLGTVKRPQDGEGPGIAPPASTLLADLWPAVRERFEERLRGGQFGGAEQGTVVTRSGMLRRLPLSWRMPDAPSPCVASIASGEGAEVVDIRYDDVAFDWAGETARHVGTVVHRMLRRIACEGVASWTAARVQMQEPLYRAALNVLGVPPEDLDRSAAQVAQALLATLNDPKGRWILDPSHSAESSELAVTGVVDGCVVSGVIDRTFVDAEGTRWIIDFKTGIHEGGDRERFLDKERERYSGQMQRYARLMRVDNGDRIRLGLYFPLLGGWREWSPTPAAGA
jgi:ATP-dependent exoDNAse (exonuclease V) beta subunit